MEENTPEAFYVGHLLTNSEDEISRKLSVTNDDINGNYSSGVNREIEPEKTCNILGFSTRRRSSRSQSVSEK
jgi:hypothetical protein